MSDLGMGHVWGPQIKLFGRVKFPTLSEARLQSRTMVTPHVGL